FVGINQDLTWYLSAVYAECGRIERRNLWLELSAIRSQCDGPWVVCGDFNVTRYPTERTNGHRITGAMAEFFKWINEMELFDPPLFGGSYTWRRGENHMSASTIDRCLFCSQWEELFLQIKHNLLPNVGSDHRPIMLVCGDWKIKKSYFKFEQWWLGAEGFKDKVRVWWASFQVSGTPASILATKLKLLKDKLKEWNRERNVSWRKKEEILNEISMLENNQDQRLLTEDELAQKIATAHKSFNAIDSLEVEGETITDPAVIKENIQNFYQNLYKEPENWRPDFNLHEAPGITNEEQERLRRQFEEEEVLNSIKLCASDKAPGPDGYPMCFYQCFWEVLKEDIMNTLQHFHSHQVFERSFNAF
ncbi:hypothetical protein MTR67_002690, partial [Solanum verrucosum]